MGCSSEILLIRRNGFGDVLCVMPLVTLCRQRFPEARITLVIDARSAALAPFLKGIDEVAVIPQRGNKYVAILETLWSLRKKKFTLAISAKGSPMKLMNFFLYGLKAERRIAYREGGPVLFRPEEESHQALRCLRLLDPSFEKVPQEFYPRLEAAPLPLGLPHPTVLVSVTNNRIGSLLDLDKYARLLNRLPYSVVINGEAKDAKRADMLAKMLTAPAEVILTSEFADFVRLVAGVDAVFSGDGGLMHVAAALDKPQVVLFGGTNIWEWAPLSDRAVCLDDPHNVNFIPEETIFQALEAIL